MSGRKFLGYRIFGGKEYVSQRDVKGRSAAEKAVKKYRSLGYLVRMITGSGGWFDIFIRDPKHGTNVRYGELKSPYDGTRWPIDLSKRRK